MEDHFKKCFVCGNNSANLTIQKSVNLPVCNQCIGTEAEKKAVEELLEGLAEGFVCGCI